MKTFYPQTMDRGSKVIIPASPRDLATAQVSSAFLTSLGLECEIVTDLPAAPGLRSVACIAALAERLSFNARTRSVLKLDADIVINVQRFPSLGGHIGVSNDPSCAVPFVAGGAYMLPISWRPPAYDPSLPCAEDVQLTRDLPGSVLSCMQWHPGDAWSCHSTGSSPDHAVIMHFDASAHARQGLRIDPQALNLAWVLLNYPILPWRLPAPNPTQDSSSKD